MTVWKAPGVRASASESAVRRAKIARNRAQRREDLETARDGWRRGLIRPWYITAALDLGGHYGPEVDAACGVEEPTVDHWETGEIYPTFEQLCALAELTGFSPAWFVRDHTPFYVDPRDTSLRFHVRLEQTPPPIERFQLAAIKAIVS